MIVRYINKIPKKYQKTSSRRKQYYKEGDRIPKKYSTPLFSFKKEKLWSKETGFIIKNKAFVDKPRFWVISGNSVFSAGVSRFLLNDVGKFMKEFYKSLFDSSFDVLKTTNWERYRIDLELIFYYSFLDLENTKKRKRGGTIQDPDNHWLYLKWLHDAFVEASLVPDDNAVYFYSSGKATVEFNDEKAGDALLKVHFYEQ